MNDLLALAIIRRLLLELGRPAGPETSDHTVGPVERWMHEPRPNLNGQTLLEALASSDGELRVRGCLQSMIDELER